MRRLLPKHTFFWFALFGTASLAQLAISIHYAGASLATFEGQGMPTELARLDRDLQLEMVFASMAVAGLLVLLLLGFALIERRRVDKDEPSRSNTPVLIIVGLALLLGTLAHGWILSERISHLVARDLHRESVILSKKITACMSDSERNCMVEEVLAMTPGTLRAELREPEGAILALQGESSNRGLWQMLFPEISQILKVDSYRQPMGEKTYLEFKLFAQGNRQIKTIGSFMLNAVTATFILFCILVEASLILQWDSRPNGQEIKSDSVTLSLIRPAVFLFIFGLDLSLSFLPLYMEKIYAPVFGLPKELIMGLPISAEFICTGIAIYLAGVWVDRRSWRQPFLWGAVLGSVGSLLAGTASEPLQLILGRGVSGFGFGFILIAAQYLVVSNSAGRSMGFGLATLFAGIYAGNLCGNVVGAMLADIFGYGPVFIAGSLVCLAVLAIGRFIPDHLADGEGSGPQSAARQETTSSGAFAGFLGNRIVLALILLCAFPSSVAIVGFFHYFVPIHLHALGVTPSGIGRMMMVYSLCLIYLGPRIGRMVDDSSDKRQFVFFGCLLGSAAFLSFAWLDGLWAVFTGIVLLGLSSCFILPSQIAYLLAQPVSENLGVGKALGIYRATSRVGQAVGPLIFGVILVEQGSGPDLFTIGGTYLAVSLLFFMVTAKGAQRQGEFL